MATPILDSGLNIIGTTTGSTPSFPGYTTSAFSGVTSSVIYDTDLQIVGTNVSGVIRFRGLTATGITGSYTKIVDSGLNVIGKHKGTCVNITGLP